MHAQPTLRGSSGTSATTPVAPRVLVVGCGAIGGITAAHLLAGGWDVTVATTNRGIAAALQRDGLRVRGPSAPRHAVPVPHLVETASGAPGRFDYVLLAMQPPQVEAAARDALGVLLPEGRVVCFQNGLCEERLAPVIGAQRVIGAVVAWGGSVLEPGCYERTSAGGFALGTLTGQVDASVERLARILSAVGPVHLTTNLAGVRWSKLAINSAISTLGTIGGDRLGVLMQKAHGRRLALEVMSEVVAVARAEGVRLEKLSGTLDLEWLALGSREASLPTAPSLWLKHAVLLAVGTRYRKLRSSMGAAIARGRVPAVDFLNGEVEARAARHAIAVPVNAAARAFVWDIAQGRRQASHAALRDLYESTRRG